MLQSLHIQNLAIIDDLTVEFGSGFNVLTGETGAGKSILISAIQLLLGMKGGAELVRHGASMAVVEGLFEIPESGPVERTLEARGIKSGQQLVLRRTINKDGKSKAYLNGQMSPVSVLSEVGRLQVNIYGQHENQSLLDPAKHLDLLDEHGRINSIRTRWEQLWRQWSGLRVKLQEELALKEDWNLKRELWEFQLKEISEASLYVGEEEALEEELRVLLNSQRIQDTLQRAQELLYSQRGSALEQVQTTLREIREVCQVASSLEGLRGNLESAELYLQEAVSALRDHSKRIWWDGNRLAEVDGRLQEIRRLKRKYKTDVPGILALASQLKQRLSEADTFDQRIQGLHEEVTLLEEELKAVGRMLTEARVRAAQELSSKVEDELKDLGVSDPRFQVLVAPLKEGTCLELGGLIAGPRGMDEVEFLLSTNIGETPRPLWKIASGGELSRIMLAMKKVLADAVRVPTLIFDEIDSGIGGAVAHALGEKLAYIARTHQVLCVTHLAQVACFADHHLRVSKKVRGGRTVTTVEELDEQGRLEELSRMMAGRVISPKAREHAIELLERAQNRKWEN